MANLPDFYRGDTKTYNVSFIKAGVALDISSQMLFFTLKSKKALTDINAEFTKKITFPVDEASASGLGVLVLPADETATIPPGTYYFDFQLVNPLTVPANVTTMASGKVNVLEDITQGIV